MASSVPRSDVRTARRRPRSAPVYVDRSQAAPVTSTPPPPPTQQLSRLDNNVHSYPSLRPPPPPPPALQQTVPPRPARRRLDWDAEVPPYVHSRHQRETAVRRAYSAAHLHSPPRTVATKPAAPPPPSPNERIMALLHGPPRAHRPPPTPTLAEMRQTPQSEQETTSRQDYCDPKLQRPNSATLDGRAHDGQQTRYHPSMHNRRPLIKCPSWKSPPPPAKPHIHPSLPGFSPYSGPVDGDGPRLTDGGRRAYREQRGRCARGVWLVHSIDYVHSFVQ